MVPRRRCQRDAHRLADHARLCPRAAPQVADGPQGSSTRIFDQIELDVLVVLDDACELIWPMSGPLAEVCRREEVYEHIERRLLQCRSAIARPPPLNELERRTLGEFLCTVHQPLGHAGPL